MKDENHDTAKSVKNGSFLAGLIYRRGLAVVLFFGLAGFLIPAIYGLVNGFPVPYVHDEFSYLVAGDTFAHGRLSNPTPKFYEHYESPHLLFTPTYASKYPPVQGIFLALGQVIFGHPIFGVWLSCGLTAAALFWMLSAWTRPRWAFLGTVLMLVFIGINSYWAQSYWGGMAAALGGCLFFGSFRRLLEKLSFVNVFLLIAGGVILMNSRPFEGLLAMTPSLFVLLVHLIRDEHYSFPQKFRRLILPAFLLTFIALSGMAYYNFRVTGDAFTFPYNAHQKQYFSTPLFIFQSPVKSELKGHLRLRNLYQELSYSPPLLLLDDYGLPKSVYIQPLYAFLFIIIRLPFFLFSLPLTIFLYVLLIPVVKRNKRLMLVAGTIVFTSAGMALATYWDNAHYSAPLTACFYLLLIETFRYCAAVLRNGAQRKYVPVCLIFLTLFSFYDSLMRTTDTFFPAKAYSGEIYHIDNLNFEKPVSLVIPKRATFLKQEIEKYAENLPGKYLALVSYDSNYTPHDEIVFNKADIENSKLIWAYDLGEDENREFVEYHSDRKILYVKITLSQMIITPR